MGQKLFSETLPEFTGQINNPSLTESISELKLFLGKKKLNIFQWDEDVIAIALTVAVDLPPLGNFQNIDIRKLEPVLIKINLNDYPGTAPIVFPDRLDFPKNNLAHLYVAIKGKPPAFCLVRGSLAEWYSNKRLKDLYTRVGNWLRDAVSGQLSEDGEQFDPIRLEGYAGTMIYDYDQLATIVNKTKSYLKGSNFAIALFERNILENRMVFKLSKIITQENIHETLEDFNKEKEKDDSESSKKNYYFGYVIWSENEIVFNQYSVNFPDDWNSLKEFCLQYGIQTTNVEKHIAESNLNIFVSIPVIVGIRRPKNIIGFSSNIEFVNFTVRVQLADVANEKINNDVLVKFYIHSQPLSRAKAKQISGSQSDLGVYSLIAGCGALGSKIIMHFARTGITNFLLADPDDLSPHNLVRHALLGNSEGLNKAESLKKEISNLYPYEKLSLLISAKTSGEAFLGIEISKLFNWILDFTASNAFTQSLVNAELDFKTRVARAFITDFGNIGIVFFEGKDRNPRIDDLQVMMYAQYEKSPFISAWLKRENENKLNANNLSITVGVGCNSETTILSDDIISLHSAYISGVIKAESKNEQTADGRIYMNEITSEPFYSNTPRMMSIAPMNIFPAINDPSWQIRMRPGIIEAMKKEMGLAMPSETGGVFVGCANYKTKTIHVTEIIKAPPDSKANAVCFFRGVEGLPDTINQINESTGHQLGYIGEWHTHPFGPNSLSATDANTVKRFKKDFSTLQSPLPAFLMIITPETILPYVY